MKTRTFLQVITIAVLFVPAAFVAKRILGIERSAGTDEHGHAGHDHGDEHDHGEEDAKGPHGGRLLGEKDLQAEVTLYEPAGLEPAFRVYFFEGGKPIEPVGISLRIALHRINRIEEITFEKEGMFLASKQPVVEPHSFDAKVVAARGGKEFRWSYESAEARVTMSDESLKKAGIGIETAGPSKLAMRLELNGRIAPNEEQMAHVSPRFPGIVKSVTKRLGDHVDRGEVLATVESNESLRTYDLTAEIAGTVIMRHATLGEFVSGQEALFTIADLSTVWADFSVYRQDFPMLREGQRVMLEAGPEGEKTSAKIDYISPFGSENSQTMLARAVVQNSQGALRPGLFIRGTVVTDEVEVPVAVKSVALQTYRDWDVVFIRVGEFFEAVPVKTGRRDGEWVEILSGLKAGERYAADNSFIVKADIGKAGAAHDH